mmetsp:Transcript_37553/g.121393  ORF Transcript_37553/g.121393 Transcript_37553/m.121393 type:complete len:238 (-) Transcript_37553:534-1247(-)
MRSWLAWIRPTMASTVSACLDGMVLKMPICRGTSYGSLSSMLRSCVVPCATTAMLSAAIISRVRYHGGSMTTSPVWRHASTDSTRSCWLSSGKLQPRCRLTTASECTPTSRKSPSAAASRRKATCPAWNMSQPPSTYTTLAPAGGAPHPSANKRYIVLVGKNLLSRSGRSTPSPPSPPSPAVLASLARPPAAGLTGEAAAARWWSRVRSSIRPTISVVETPSVRGMVRYLPSARADS